MTAVGLLLAGVGALSAVRQSVRKVGQEVLDGRIRWTGGPPAQQAT